ncbi:hypothetical protein CTA1_8143 [Colletotrichum tanaceti]|uniref:Uncharacterized protein n=1 Tax=Colletotrichum tanaceti TaxID=1306861 RepID=A0A4U6WZG0_9PEZI|nr:hypothetical protein CTA1_8143 [Colletotrichum tanaceti]
MWTAHWLHRRSAVTLTAGKKDERAENSPNEGFGRWFEPSAGQRGGRPLAMAGAPPCIAHGPRLNPEGGACACARVLLKVSPDEGLRMLTPFGSGFTDSVPGSPIKDVRVRFTTVLYYKPLSG